MDVADTVLVCFRHVVIQLKSVSRLCRAVDAHDLPSLCAERDGEAESIMDGSAGMERRQAPCDRACGFVFQRCGCQTYSYDGAGASGSRVSDACVFAKSIGCSHYSCLSLVKLCVGAGQLGAGRSNEGLQLFGMRCRLGAKTARGGIGIHAWLVLLLR